jgi:PAS domain S-box-containing protein
MSEVTARRERRRNAAAQMRAVLDGALDAVIGMDATGRVTFWNPRAEKMFGWSREEALGEFLAELIIPPAQRDEHRRGLERFLRTGEGPLLNRHVEVTGMRRDGTEFPVELSVTAVREEKYHTFHAFIRDITERRQAESERERLLAETEAARDEAEAASRAKDQFLATLSHELRTPLTSIVGWVYLLRSGRLDDGTVRRGLETIDRNVMLQANLVSGILDMSRIRSAKLQLNVRPLLLAPLVAAVVVKFMPAARAKGVRVQPVLDPSAGPVLADPDRLQQVVWNLLSNAIKFTPAGGRVSVRVVEEHPHVKIEIEDSGIGMPAEFLPHAFELFRQRDSSNTRAHGGLGLGLAVVRQLVELHGGTVSVASAGEGQGATFTVTLPSSTVEPGRLATEAAAVATEAATIDTPSLEGVRVLVADDSEEVRDVLTRILERAGAHVTTAATGKEAFAALITEPVHVMVTEIELPDQSGYALLEQVRAMPRERGGGIPAVAVSLGSRTEDRIQSLQAGFQMHLSKPVQPQELLAVVVSLSGRYQPPP